MRYRFLDDVAIADVCFETYGEDLNELFENAGLALTEVMVDTVTVRPSQNVKLKMQNVKLEDLLFDFLSELVFLKDRDAVLFSKFKVNVTGSNGEWRLEAGCFGEKIDPEKQHLRADVKAVTWHMFNINKTEGGWKARVVVDI